jgi:exopolysaccharide biosynthesis polyprenyl glycosylphosphotransferase
MGAIGRISRLERFGDAFDAADLLGVLDPRSLGLVHRRSRARRGWLVRRSLAAADLLGLALAFGAATALHGGGGAGEKFGLDGEIVLFLATLPAWFVVAVVYGLYDRDEQHPDHPTSDDIVGVVHLVTTGTWLLLAGSLFSGLATPEIPKLITFWLLAILLVPIGRTIARALCRRTQAYLQNTLILGAGEVGQLIARKLIRHPEYGINVVGFVDSRPRTRRADLPDHLTVLGTPEHLNQIIETLDVERVVVAFTSERSEQTLETVRRLNGLNVQVDIVPRLFELVGPKDDIHMVEGLPLVGLPPTRMARTSRLIKRAIDVIGASLMLIASAPLFLWIAWRVSRDSEGPIFFTQTRVGLGQREFTTLKFRTMRTDTDASAHQAYIGQIMSAAAEPQAGNLYKLDRSDAITPFGSWLRKTSLDELPQLINVFKGDMSLVGPRPCIPYELEHFKPHQFERFLVPQGLTGLWQVTARAHASFGEALDMDVAYVRGWSLGLDLRLLLRTPLEMLRQRTATA